jgi:hypothetical protein
MSLNYNMNESCLHVGYFLKTKTIPNVNDAYSGMQGSTTKVTMLV